MADLVSGVGGFIDGINHALGSNIIGLLVIMQLPLLIAWVILTILIVIKIFYRRHVIVWPWQWKYGLTDVIPYADSSIDMFPEPGALCLEDGITRLKMKTQNVIMQKMDTIDVYPNKEVIVVSMGPNKRSYGRRIIDEARKTIFVDIENPQVAIRQHIDAIKKNDPDWFINQHATLAMIGSFYVFITMANFAAATMTIYPVFWSLALKAQLG